jgi:hypothetical protein
VESTVLEVLILNGLEVDRSYEVVTQVVLESLGEFEGRRGGGAWLMGRADEVRALTNNNIITHWY